MVRSSSVVSSVSSVVPSGTASVVRSSSADSSVISSAVVSSDDPPSVPAAASAADERTELSPDAVPASFSDPAGPDAVDVFRLLLSADERTVSTPDTAECCDAGSDTAFSEIVSPAAAEAEGSVTDSSASPEVTPPSGSSAAADCCGLLPGSLHCCGHLPVKKRIAAAMTTAPAITQRMIRSQWILPTG